MKSIKNFVFIIVILFSLTSCARRYSNTIYNENVIDNKTLAVLPYQVTTVGRIPDNLTDEMLLEIEEGESQAFQSSLYHQMLDRLARKKYRHLNIKIQAFDETNRKLSDAGFGIRETWDVPAAELAKILEVDAVVRSSVHKNQYLTNLESYGIFLAQQILFTLSSRAFWFGPSNKTSDVRISTSIIDIADGNALWSASRLCPTNWSRNTYDVIEEINFSITRRLPR